MRFTGNCIPKDRYLPLSEWYSVWRVRAPVRLTTYNFGFYWNSNEYSDLEVNAISRYFAWGRPDKHERKYFNEFFSKELVPKIRSMLTSHVTGKNWTNFPEKSPTSYWPINDWHHNVDFVLPGKKYKAFQLGVTCGHYTIYTAEMGFREYSEDEKCIQPVNTKIGDCNFCPNLNCTEVSVEDFLKDGHPEYHRTCYRQEILNLDTC